MQIDRALVWLSNVHCPCLPTAPLPSGWVDRGLVTTLSRELDDQFAISRSSVIGRLPLRLERFALRGTITIGLANQDAATPVAVGQIFVTIGARGAAASEQGPPDLLIVSVGLDLRRIDDSDVLIALVQSFEAEPRVGALAVRYKCDDAPEHESTSLRELMSWCGELLLGSSVDVEPEKFRILELRGLRDAVHGGLRLMEPDAVKCLYGLMAGDEGWRDVPQTHAAEVLERGWNSSRDFLQIMFSGHALLVVNEKFSGSYVDNANSFFRRMFGRADPYFHTDFDLAGLDHGVLFIAERNAYWMAKARDLHRQFQELIPDEGTSGWRGRASIRLGWWKGLSGRLRSARLDQVKFRASLPSPSLAEHASMEQSLFRESGLADIVMDLDKSAASMDDVAYGLATLRVSVIILAVTFFTLIVALAAWLYPIFF